MRELQRIVRLMIVGAIAAISFAAGRSSADIFQWEYIDPSNPGLGKQQSTTLTPSGAGLNAVPNAILVQRDFTKGYFYQLNLRGARFRASNLTEAYFAGANLESISFNDANLLNADLSGANLKDTSFYGTLLQGTNFQGADISRADFTEAAVRGFTAAQLYSTASYQNRNLREMSFTGTLSNLGGWDFHSQDLTKTELNFVKLAGADFTGAIIQDVQLQGTVEKGFTANQLYSTQSYQNHALGSVDLSRNDLTGWNFSGQNLQSADFNYATLTNTDFSHADLSYANLSESTFSNTNFQHANLTNVSFYYRDLTTVDFSNADLTNCDFTQANLANADFDGAIVRSADFAGASYRGFTLTQLYSTASYQNGDLRGIQLTSNSFASANFAGKDLSEANLGSSILPGANFRLSNLQDAYLGGADLSQANFEGAALSGAQLQANFTGARFRAAILTGAEFYRAELTGADFTNADVRGTKFTAPENELALTANQLYSTASYQANDLSGITIQGNLSGWSFKDQNLTNAVLDRSTLHGVNWDGATLSGATFFVAHLEGADFSGANLDGAKFESAHLTGVDFSQRDLRAVDFYNSHLQSANFSGSQLSGVRLALADLTNANLSNSDLRNASLRFASLGGADFTGAIIRGADLGDGNATGITVAQIYQTSSYAQRDLRGVNLADVDLRNAQFAQQNLSSAKLSGTKLDNANFSEANLTGVSLQSASLVGTDFSGATVRGVVFGNATSRGLTEAALKSTLSHQQRSLGAIGLESATLTGWDFSGQDLANANFGSAQLSGTDFSDATIHGAKFNNTVSRGFTAGQLYSTRSYSQRNLTGIDLSQNLLVGWNFSDQGLSNALLSMTSLNGANFTRADLRGIGGGNAAPWHAPNWTGAILDDAIREDGTIRGLSLAAGEQLTIRDYDGDPNSPFGAIPALAIKITDSFSLDPTAALEFQFQTDEWNSTISFAAGLSISRTGRLILGFSDEVNPYNQVGRTFKLFDWSNVLPTGSFAIESEYDWNLAQLYTTGEVTLISVPELPGDFNRDNIVDAADYAVWRDGLGSVYTMEHFQIWKDHFGDTRGGGSGQFAAGPQTVPEPTSFAGMFVAMGALLLVSGPGIRAKKTLRLAS